MLQFLFRRLTAEPRRGADLFDAVTRLARERHWYVEGQVPDTLDGRFATLSTIASLVLVRLERDGERGNAAAVALTERFIEVMESEHRELGLGDPTLGKTVRKLVASLARRTGLWRSAVADGEWKAPACASLYRTDPPEEAIDHAATSLRSLWERLQRLELSDLVQGKL